MADLLPRVVDDEDAFPIVHGIIGTGVILGEIERVPAQGSGRAPEQVPEEDHQVRDIALGLIVFAGTVGAVCGPLNGEVGAQYAKLTWKSDRWQPELHTVAYDTTAVRTAFRESGLLEQGGAMARAFLLSIESGWDVALDLLDHASHTAAGAEFKQFDIVPDDVWDAAVASFDWDRYKS